jgi:hypothetical protein
VGEALWQVVTATEFAAAIDRPRRSGEELPGLPLAQLAELIAAIERL